MSQYELWCFDLNDCSTYQWLGYGTAQRPLENKCRDLFKTRKYDRAMFCIIKRTGSGVNDWETVHPVIYNDGAKYCSKHPSDKDEVGFVWKSPAGDPSHKEFNDKLKKELEKSKIKESKKS